MAKRKNLPTADAAPATSTTAVLERPFIRIESAGRVRLEDISDSPFNPRRRYDGDKLRELADAYRRCPDAIPRPLVRKRPIGFAGAGYELIHGHRRKRAAQIAGLIDLEVDVADVDDNTARMLQRAENALREDLHPLDEADWFAGWLADVAGATAESIASEIGKSPAYVRGRVKLASLITLARAELDAGRIGIGVAQLIAGLASADDQRRALEHALSEGWEGHPPATDDVAAWITSELTLDLSRAPWRLDDAMLVPEAGACAACPKRTGATADLFAGAITGDRCLNKPCWDEKLTVHVREAKRAGELLEVTSKRGDTVKKPGAPLPTDCYKPTRPTQSDLDELREDLRWDVEHEVRKELDILDSDEPLPKDKIEAKLEAAIKKSVADEFRECEHARDALVKDGPDKGQVRRVCAEPKCQVHGKEISAPKLATKPKPGASSAPASDSWEKKHAAEKAKRDIEEKVRLRALKLAIAKVKLEDGNLPHAELARVVDHLARGGSGEDRFAEALGVVWPKKGQGLAKLERATLSLALLVVMFEWDLDGWRSAPELLAFVKRHKIDVDKIRAEIKAEEKVAAAAKAPTAKPPKKKARAKAAAR